MIHSFDVDTAVQFGVEKALLLHNLWFWINKNAANNVHFHEEKYWTYNKAGALLKLLPYLKSEQKIWRLLREMEADGLVEVANFNSDKRDQTKWYALGNHAILKNYNSHASDLKDGVSDLKDGVSDLKDGVSDLKPTTFKNETTELLKIKVDTKETDSKQQIVNTDGKGKGEKKEKIETLAFGAKVRLTTPAYENLISAFGEFVVADYIEKINRYLTETEKGIKRGDYKNYATTIRNWINADKLKNPSKFENPNPVSQTTEKPNPATMQNWKEKADYLSQGRYVPGGWGAERGEDNGQWAQRVISWLRVGLDRWWDVQRQCWTFTEQSKPQWQALYKRANEMRGVVA